MTCRIIETPSHGYTTAQESLTGTQPVQLVGQDPNRRSVLVMCDPDGGSPIYVVGGPTVSATSGFKLNPGAGVSLSTTAAVYVASSTGDGTTAFAIIEYGTA